MSAYPIVLLSPPIEAVFEDLCCDLWRQLWHDPNAQRNGNKGQKQYGIDILGKSDGRLEGVQCKHKIPGKKLTLKVILEEVEKAKAFELSLHRLIIATTAPRDATLLTAVLKLSSSNQESGLFLVDIAFWDDIAAKLCEYPDLLSRYYFNFHQLARPTKQTSRTGLLSAYLHQVATNLDHIVPFQEFGLELLDRVYVKLELQHSPMEAPNRRHIKPLWGQPLGIREILNLGTYEQPQNSGRWVTLGDPGGGKTTLLRHLAASLAREEDCQWVPVFESLPRMMQKREQLFDCIVQRLGFTGQEADDLPVILNDLGREGKLLVLLDGLDEVPKDDKEAAEALLRKLSSNWPQTPLIVTSRPIGYRRPGSAFQELELLPLQKEQRREFLARWFGRRTGALEEAQAEEALATLSQDSILWELSGNPFYLKYIAWLLEEGISPQRNLGLLYDQIFEIHLEGKHRPEGQPMPAKEAVRSALNYLGFELTRENLDTESPEGLEARLLSEEAEERSKELRRQPQWAKNLRVFLTDMSHCTGIIGPYDGEGLAWRFLHPTFREALAAKELKTQWQKGGANAILLHARKVIHDESRWAEPYALLAGLVKEPDALVRALVKENRSLGLRALASAQGLQEGTLQDILELTGDWKQRSRVYLRLPELIGDPERALKLADRLRRKTTDGNDLFFLDLAIHEISIRWRDFSHTAEALRSQLYSHLKQPTEELFQSIITTVGGPESLWKEISSGRFFMGSLQGRGIRNEHPRHEVVIPYGFRIAAIPISVAQFQAFDPGYQPPYQEGIFKKNEFLLPATSISWYQAVAFCRWLRTKAEWARGARLPTEEEWEYVCRAGSTSDYWKGDSEKDLSSIGWYMGNSNNILHPAGEKPPNPWGLYDVHGNIAEWVLGLPRDYSKPQGEAIALSEWRATGGFVLRGGCYWDDPLQCRAAWRFVRDPPFGLVVDGFRVVLPMIAEGGGKDDLLAIW